MFNSRFTNNFTIKETIFHNVWNITNANQLYEQNKGGTHLRNGMTTVILNSLYKGPNKLLFLNA